VTLSLVLPLRVETLAIYGPQELEAASRSSCLIDTDLPKVLIPLYRFFRLRILWKPKVFHRSFVISFCPAKRIKKEKRLINPYSYQT